jgi:hypothetical protein
MAGKLAVLLITIVVSALPAFPQAAAPAQERVLESVVINGQTVQGVLVIQNGVVQSYACSSPQPYVTANHAESGWACFETATGMWLLHAHPAQTNSVYSQAPVYTAPPTVVYTYPAVSYYGYPYGYYPYSYYPYGYPYYPYAFGAGFGFGFGFGYVSRGPVFVNRSVVVRGPVFAGGHGVVASRPFVGGRSGGGRIGRR